MRETAARQLRRQLESHGVDGSTIDELVEHFESVVDAQLAAGSKVDDAIATALARLGEPAALAREHARVRSAFGPQPSRLASSTAVVALIAASLISPTDGWLSLDDFIAGPAALRTAALVAVFVFRSPQAAAYLFGATLCELGLWLANGLHTGLVEADPRSTALLVLLVGICAVLGPRRPTRWFVATAALAWTITVAALYGHPLGALGARVLIPIVASLAVIAVGLRLQISRVLCAVLCVIAVVPAVFPVAGFVTSTWPDVADWWRFDAVSWHAMQVIARIHAVLTLAAPIVATLVVRSGRPMRAVLGELRAGIDPRAPT
jgi:hypothetical protein